jgi:hypothetical protein
MSEIIKCKEVVVAYSAAGSQHLCETTEENYEKRETGELVSGPSFETDFPDYEAGALTAGLVCSVCSVCWTKHSHAIRQYHALPMLQIYYNYPLS